MMKRIKDIALKVKNKIVYNIEKKKAIAPILKKINTNKKAAIYLFTPTHENLGDHAIALATISMFEKVCLEYIEITDNELRILNHFNKLGIFNKRKIVFHGGGYLGTIWFSCELLSRKIVLANPDSKIIFLPNTIYYEDNEDGKTECKRSIEVYNQHHSLIFYAREYISYSFMKKIYNDVRICPDMVLSQNKENANIKRHGCLICFRSDIEKTLSDTDRTRIIGQVENVFDNSYYYTDMISDTKFDINERTEVLERKFDEFRKSKIVITDRLHGMIFSAITGTPCIVINSLSPKIKGCYKWIENLKYIKMCDDYSRIQCYIETLLENNEYHYNNSELDKMYLDLINTVIC